MIKPELHKKAGYIIIHVRTNDPTNKTKSFENYKNLTDTINPNLPNFKYAILKVIIRKYKPGIGKRVIYFNNRLSKFCSKNKIDIIENKNLDESCLSFKKLHLDKKDFLFRWQLFGVFLRSFWFGNPCQLLLKC